MNQIDLHDDLLYNVHQYIDTFTSYKLKQTCLHYNKLITKYDKLANCGFYKITFDNVFGDYPVINPSTEWDRAGKVLGYTNNFPDMVASVVDLFIKHLCDMHVLCHIKFYSHVQNKLILYVLSDIVEINNHDKFEEVCENIENKTYPIKIKIIGHPIKYNYTYTQNCTEFKHDYKCYRHVSVNGVNSVDCTNADFTFDFSQIEKSDSRRFVPDVTSV
jgi:hypothetical protein